MKLPILYEDADLVVVNKPAGVLTHPAQEKKREKTIADWLIATYPKARKACEEEGRPGIVHRLDKETSGVLILAKTAKGYKALKAQFLDRSVEKIYNSLVWGIVADDRGVVDRALGKSEGSPMQRTVTHARLGTARSALSYFRTYERFPKQNVSFVEWYPKTGRTHQIRVHARSMGHPLVCDGLYGPSFPCPAFGLTRHALHARSITFTLPSGKKKSVSAPLPLDMTKALRLLRVA